jgi:hypothetical protein
MEAGQRLELDHTVPLALNPASRGDRIVHERCNRRRHIVPGNVEEAPGSLIEVTDARP